MNNITIQFDGGCSPNPGQMYGSYSIEVDGVEIFSTTQDYGYGTNNVAEFQALHEALLKVLQLHDLTGMKISDVTLLLLTDSMIFRNRVNGAFNTTKKKHLNSPGAIRMTEWTTRVKVILDQFKSYQIQWNSREANVERFGH